MRRTYICEQVAQVQQTFDNFGVRPLIRSEERTRKVYTNVGELNAAKDGETVLVRARLYTVRGTGTRSLLLSPRARIERPIDSPPRSA
jgi:hypothetical protein